MTAQNLAQQTGRDRGRRERGAAYVELLMLAFPICLLAMVIASKLAAQSQAKLRAQWTAGLAAQRAAGTVCGSISQLSAPWMSQGATTTIKNRGGITNITSLLARISQAGALVSDLKVGMSGLRDAIAAQQQQFPADILTQQQLVATNWSTQTVTLLPSAYYFQPLADRLMPDPVTSLSAQAAFVCNEPNPATHGNGNGGKDSPLDGLRLQLTAWAFDEAQRLY